MAVCAQRRQRLRPLKFQKASMHIPDGYLSPSTCAVLYAAAAPFWYTALRRVKKSLDDAAGTPVVSDGGAFLCHYDVQPASARRHHGARGGRGNFNHHPGTVGLDSRHLHCAGDPSRFLWRRGDHDARSQLLQHGDCGIACGLRGLSAWRRGARPLPLREGSWPRRWRATRPSMPRRFARRWNSGFNRSSSRTRAERRFTLPTL